MIGTPAKIASSMAGNPSLVPGILMNRFGRSARLWRLWPTRSCQPRRRPKVARPRAIPSHRRRTFGRGSAETDRRPGRDLPRPARRIAVRWPCAQHLPVNGFVVVGAVLDGLVENRGIRREARHGQLVNIMPQRAAAQQPTGKVIEPKALADVVEFLGGVHEFIGSSGFLRG